MTLLAGMEHVISPWVTLLCFMITESFVSWQHSKITPYYRYIYSRVRLYPNYNRASKRMAVWVYGEWPNVIPLYIKTSNLSVKVLYHGFIE